MYVAQIFWPEAEKEEKVHFTALGLGAKKSKSPMCLQMDPKRDYKDVQRLEIWFHNSLITIDVCHELEKDRDFEIFKVGNMCK